MAKHLSEDEVTLVVNAKADKAQQNIRKFSKEIDNLGERNKSLQRQMESLELAGKKNTDSWKQRREEYGRNATQIRNLKQQIAAETKALDLNALTMAQLRQQARSLQRQLDNTSKTINPEDWKKLSSRLSDVRNRMGELSNASKNLVEKYSNPQTMSFFRGELFVRFGELVGKALQKVKEFAAEGIGMAESADGVIHAFRRLDQPGLLDNLRKATKGTVSDIELMKAAVKAKDFHIPLEDLGKYLSFAQLKAQQTGQSLDYMVDSIVTGLGRKSPMILDNLGLSAAEISEKTKETGDFMKGVASIVEKNLASAGETYISAADRAAQKTTELENKQLQLGEALLPLKEKAVDTFGSMKISIMECIVWLMNHRKASAALGLAITSLTISMTVLNTAFRTWIAQTAVAKVAIAGWTSAVTTLKGVYLLVAAAINVMRGNTIRATAQMRLFNLSCKANVILLLVTAIVAAGVALYSYMRSVDKVKVAMVNFNLEHARTAAAIKKQNKEIQKSVNDSTAEEITKIKLLQKTIHDTSKSYNQRKKAIQDMQAIVPGYHATISKEGRLFNENTKAIDIYIQNLRRAARAEAAYEKMKDNEKKILDAQDTVSDSSQKGRNVSNAAQRRGINMAAGERVQKKTQVFEGATPGSAMTNEYYVVVDKNGKVLREISKDKAVPIMKDQEWGDMFGARKKVAQDKVHQYTTQNDRLQKVIEQNGGINQKFKSGGKPQGGSPVGSVGAELDIISAKIEALKAKRLTIKVGDTKGLKAIDAQIAALEKRKSSLEYGKSSGKTKTKTHKGPNPDDVATKDFTHDRAQDLDAEKRSYDKSLNALKESLAKKSITQEQYNASASALNIQHQTNLLDIEKAYLQRSENMVFKDAAKKKALHEGQAKAVADQQQAANTAYIEAEKEYYESLEKIQQLAPNKAQTLKEECDATLLFLDGYYKASLQRAKANGEREKEVSEYYEAAKTAIIVDYAKKAEEQKAQARQEYGLDTFSDQYAARRKKIEDDSVLNEQERQQALTLLDQQAEEHRLQIRQQYGLASQQELYNAELDQLKMHLRNKEISEEEYEEAVKNMKIAKMKEAFDFYSNLSSGAVQALQQAEEANVDAKYDAEIEAAKKAGKDTTELEKKKADEKLKIQKKYADVNFAIKASQIIADTATSIMKAYADLGPIAGSIAAALMGVTGVAQLSAANAERQRVKRMSLNGAGGSASASGARVATGLESGGSIDVERRQDGKMFRADYDPYRRGFIDKPTVLVGEGGYGHSKEWVASNAAVENPTVAPFIDIIDRAQRAGTIRTLDMNKFLVQQAQGRVSGGYVTPTVNDVRGVAKDSYKDTLIERLTDVLDRLSVDGIPASVSLNEIEQKQQLQDKARRFGSK
ncbi:2-oxoacid:ferredoxin oxidoreductase subunit delta [Prevotella melaninogenica]|uniref:2-oxoacid:ferredoxin oxidoreductase subunit delta n=1 Tax=Prevotella melaninogenica TaxID=28132 RepID=UPI001C5ECA1D|nr:2-oxoacid:ferredoxin oxidoreductase subunit delta [Prevotella melaninogenica]MBW4724661.1 2-oxoacid:ferredoxin oxidoreductase subunit delta [Prevotella melaninogenica]